MSFEGFDGQGDEIFATSRLNRLDKSIGIAYRHLALTDLNQNGVRKLVGSKAVLLSEGILKIAASRNAKAVT